MSKINASFKQQLNQFIFVASCAIGSIYLVKTLVNKQRDAKFIPEHIQNAEGHDSDNTQNIAKIQPGLPISTGQYKRKSEYEGAGNSYSSRKGGDRFSGLLDFEWLFGSKDK